MSGGTTKKHTTGAVNQKERQSSSDPIKSALESFKTMITSPDTDMLSLWGLQVDVTTNQEAQRTKMINELLALQESGNLQLEGAKIKQYVTDFLAVGSSLPSETNVPTNLIAHIRDKKPLTIAGSEQDANKLQDALEIVSIILGTEAIGAVYAHMVESVYPDRKNKKFDQTELLQKMNTVQINNPKDLLKLITSKNIPLSGETQNLVNQLANPTNPLMQAYASEEFGHVVKTTKEAFLQRATAYTPITADQTRGVTKGTEESSPQPRENNDDDENETQKNKTQETKTEQTALLPPWLRGTEAPQSTSRGQSSASASSPQEVITVSDSRTYPPPPSVQSGTTTTTQTQATSASGSSGNGLFGIFAGLGIVFGTLYLSQNKGTPSTPDTKNFWGNVGKTGLIGLGLTAGTYGAYKAYEYFSKDKTGGNAQATTTQTNGTPSENILYPVPGMPSSGADAPTPGSTTPDETTPSVDDNPDESPIDPGVTPPPPTPDPAKEPDPDPKEPDPKEPDQSAIPGPETGAILTEEQQKQLAALTKEKIDELNAKKTALDETQKILDALPGEHGKRVAKMYNDVITRKDLNLITGKPIQRKKGDTVTIIDPEKNPKTMYLIEEGIIKGRFPVSIGKNGIGNKNGSEKTSSGIMVFSSTEIKGASIDTAKPDILGISSKKDAAGKEYNQPGSAYRPGDYAYPQITARKLPLYGLEKKNHNAYTRGVFCHGTNNPQELGYATSQGCVRLSNADAIQLAEYIKNKKNSQKKVFLGVIDEK